MSTNPSSDQLPNFYSQHRKLIDARKADLVRVGIAPPDVPLPCDVAGSQADALSMPTTTERPILDATHKPAIVGKAKAEYAQPTLPLKEE